MTAREVDIHTLPGMLTALRLPSFRKLWAEIATRADTEGWPPPVSLPCWRNTNWPSGTCGASGGT
jgi:hypothetical protein